MTGCPRPSGRPPQAVWPSGSRAHPDYTRSIYLLTQLKSPFYLTSLTDALIFPPSSLHGFKPHARLFATDIGDWWSTTLPQVIQIKRFTFYLSLRHLSNDDHFQIWCKSRQNYQIRNIHIIALAVLWETQNQYKNHTIYVKCSICRTNSLIKSFAEWTLLLIFAEWIKN